MKKICLKPLKITFILGVNLLLLSACSGLQSVAYYDGIYDEQPEYFRSEPRENSFRRDYYNQKALEHLQFSQKIEKKKGELPKREEFLPEQPQQIIVNNYREWGYPSHFSSPFWGSSLWWDYDFYYRHSPFYSPYRIGSFWGFSLGSYDPFWHYNYGYYSPYYGYHYYSPYYGYAPYYGRTTVVQPLKRYSYTEGRRGGDDRYEYSQNRTQNNRNSSQVITDYENRYRRNNQPTSSAQWERNSYQPNNNYNYQRSEPSYSSPSYNSGGNMPSRSGSGTTRRDY